MAHGVFLFGRTLRECVIPSFRTEKWVVAETAVPGRSLKYITSNLTVEKMTAAANNESYGRTETRRTRSGSGKFLQQECVVSGVIMRAAAEAGAVYAGGTSERFHLKARVVGKAVVAILFLDPQSLGEGIALKSIGILGNIVMASYVGKRQDFHPVAEDGADFRELMGVIGGEN